MDVHGHAHAHANRHTNSHRDAFAHADVDAYGHHDAIADSDGHAHGNALHAGHEGAKGGGGHFSLTIVSPQFAGKNTVARHRMIYAALGAMMQQQIHALAIRAYAPGETNDFSKP